MRRWLTDWKLIATWTAALAAGFLLALLVATVVDSSVRANAAIEAAREASAASQEIAADSQRRTVTVRRRIDLLNGRIQTLTGQLDEAHQTISRLETQVDALSAQLAALDVEPVVVTEQSGRQTAQTRPPPDDCERRNPQGRCVEPQGDGRG